MPESLQDGLLGLDYQELSTIAQKFGQPEFRARQLFDALYPQRLTALDSVSTLPKPFRAALQQEGLDIRHPRVEKSFQSIDGTIRYLIAMADGETVETVWMPEGDDGETGDGTEAGDSEWHRATICVSSQVGCAVNCQFCLTALLGVKRNLSAGEIVGQVIAVLNDRQVDMERQRVNIVFMGMGEPFLNYPQLHEGRAAAGGRRGLSGIAHDGLDFRNYSAHPRLWRRAGASQAGHFAQRVQ